MQVVVPVLALVPETVQEEEVVVEQKLAGVLVVPTLKVERERELAGALAQGTTKLAQVLELDQGGIKR